ncbi:glycoside hydrolase family 114 protein, partial [Stipitochalara longipes BDJ]
ICYFSAGTSESFRSDVGCFNHHLGAQDYGCNFGGDFGNEFWLNTSSLEVRKIMQSRIQHAADRGCSAIDPDNIDGYGNRNGIGATEADAIDFVKFLSLEARSRGMGIGLKNLIGITPNLTSDVDFAVNEQCIEFMECDKYSAFFSATIPVFNI